MSFKRSMLVLTAVGACVFGATAGAQLVSVPAKEAGDWVKQLQLQLDQDWEWVETYPDRVFFMTRLQAERKDDIVTTWMRVEFRDVQKPGSYRSIASKDQWDCTRKRRGTQVTIQYRWPNLQGDDPFIGRNPLLSWEGVQPGTIGEQLLEFACGIHPAPAQQLVTPPAAAKPPARKGK